MIWLLFFVPLQFLFLFVDLVDDFDTIEFVGDEIDDIVEEV